MEIVLGIESSCDETAAALVGGDRTIIAQRIASQDEAHRPYGGVVPEIAARAHVERLSPLIGEVLAEAGMELTDVDAIAATAGPGLIGGVMVGLVTAKALAMASDKPLIAVNHLEGHALSPRLADASLEFPYLLLLVSGGHCQLLVVEGVGKYRRLATTIDDALGEAFDKSAKILGLGYPGGPALERMAANGNPRAVPLPRPLLGSAEPHFSFAGLKSAVMRAKQSGVHADADIAAAFQQAAIDCVIGLMPAPQGVMHWPADGENHSVLCDEARWPLANDSVDRLAILHGLETSDHPLALLDEAHRVLAPRGRALIVVPSRGGIWARSDATPFGFGRPYSRGQLEKLLAEAGFVCSGHASALFFPPSKRRFWMQSARGLERLGRRWAPQRVGGVLIVEAMRRDAVAPRGLRVGNRQPLSVLAGIPQSGAQPAWRMGAPAVGPGLGRADR